MPDKSARIASLKRYISLLQQEEKRLKWVSTSTIVSTSERTEAQMKIKSISEKLIKAEEELFGLGSNRR